MYKDQVLSMYCTKAEKATIARRANKILVNFLTQFNPRLEAASLNILVLLHKKGIETI